MDEEKKTEMTNEAETNDLENLPEVENLEVKEEVAEVNEPSPEKPVERVLEGKLGDIETQRATFCQEYKKQRRINNIITIVCGVISLGVVIGLYSQIFIAFIIIAVVMIALLIYSSTMKKKVDEKARAFIATFYTLNNDYVFDQPAFQNMTYQVDDKLAEDDFPKAGFIKDISHVGSRNIVHGEMNGIAFKAADCLAKVTYERKSEVVYLGKFYIFDVEKEYEGKTIIYIAPKDDNGAGPNDIEELEAVNGLDLPDRIRVWSSDPDVKKHLPKKVRDALLAFEPNAMLIDVAISLHHNHIYVAFSYEDSLMTIPLLEPFKAEPTEQYAEDVAKLVNLMSAWKK